MNMRMQKMGLMVLCMVFFMSTGTQAAGPVKLTFANWLPPHNAVSKSFEEWGAEFEKQTNGKCVVELHHGGVLAAIPQAYDALTSGLVDISEVVTMDVRKPFPLTNIPSLPFYNVPAVTYTKAWYENVYRKGYIDDEFKEVIILFQFSGMGEDFLAVNPIKSVDELKGMKVVFGGAQAKGSLLKIVKSVGVVGGPPDAYMMLQKGIVKAAFMPGAGLQEFHWDEFIKYIIEPLRVGTAIHSVLMNKDTYNKLPADVKKVIAEMNVDARISIKLAAAFDGFYKNAIDTFLNDGGKVVNWTDDEVKKLNDMAKPLWTEWISAQEAKGIPAKKVVDAFYNGLKAQGVATPALGYAP